MIIILGLVILLAAVIVGLAGIFTNSGSTHGLTHSFAVFGYHVTGSTGTLFLYGIVVGAIALLGLGLLLAGARRTSRRGRVARRGLKQSRRETASASQERDALIDQREIARTYAAAQPGDGTNEPDHDRPDGHDPSLPEDTHWHRLRHLVKPRAASDGPATGSPVPDATDSPPPAQSPTVGTRP
jgi:FtsZ-interacting cell division protein ZipA